MLGETFYNETIRDYMAIFGTMFNNLYITKNESDSNTNVQQFRIPLSYGPRSKVLEAVNADPNKDREVSITLPRMSFEIVGYTYASERSLHPRNEVLSKQNVGDKNIYRKMRQPSPWDIEVQLSIMTYSTEEGNRIVEQILPWFTPGFPISYHPFPNEFPSYKLDTQVILQSVTNEHNYQGGVKERSTNIWTLDFTVQGWVFGAVQEAKIIKLVKANIYPNLHSQYEYERVTVQPGLTAAGEPTSFSQADLVQAEGTCSVLNGQVHECFIDPGGFGYSSGSVTFSDPPVGVDHFPAKGRLIIDDYQVIGVDVYNTGNGYVANSPPSMNISAPDMASINYAQIDENDNYGYIVTIEEYPNVS